ncbi:MAG: type II toxin-antitoxin system VapC family toxin [Candidatus Bathyarchaeia archaeon]|jgi:predicted nucleic acid-binding protein
MKRYLLDASAFMFLIKKSNAKSVIECLQDSIVLDLTYYEVGNAIWKESTLTKFLTPEDSKTLEKVAQTILMKTDWITSEAVTFQKILEIAKNEKLSFYDSSYIYFAKEKDLKLITEDKQLKAKAQKYVDVQTITTLLSP